MNITKSPGKSVEQGVNILSLGEAYENIDEVAMDGLRGFLTEEAKTVEPPRLILDMSGVNFFGSSFIELLFVVSKRLTERKGTFAICGLSTYCKEVIQITHLDHVWTIRETRAEAIETLIG